MTKKIGRRGKAKNIVLKLTADLRRRIGQIGAIPFSGVSGANAAVSVTLAADALSRYVLHALSVSYSAAPTAGRVTITDGGTTILDLDISTAGVTNIPLGGSSGAQGAGKNRAMVITLAAAGAAVVGKIAGAYEPVG